MYNLKNELNEMIDLFQTFNISEEKQRDIIINGVYFGFDGGWGEHEKLNCFQFANFIKMLKMTIPNFTTEQLFIDLQNNNDNLYKEAIKFFLQNYSEENIKRRK